ncbi:LOW QUALITY PROTEIN: C-C chemokine receptor type 1-like [Gouania willdenowi]|uniref:LOW QUALITY PROTEIN: C-C chemokine receptor type 1-like n=1 Tax=Gouania willdenowi TaxID=441366 RepID=UPI0010560679|nr:LOW QUALITY PROTEIN: C-C chemokine receptor type 1-like [Gouania willdenowi]
MDYIPDDYDYGNYSNYSEEYSAIAPCSRDADNMLGAHLSIIYYFMFVFSVCGNVLVLAIIHRFESVTTVTNILLMNLVLSSLIFISSLPFIGFYMQRSDWTFGKVMCKLVGSVYYLGFYSSVLFLTLLTFDRHLAVVYSVGVTCSVGVARLRNRSYAVVSCSVVWIVSGLACIRPMTSHTTFVYIDNKTLCEEFPGDVPDVNVELLRTSEFYLQLFVFLILPLAVIIYCYVRISITVLSSKISSRFKTVRLIFFIVLLFFLSWIPFNVIMLMFDADKITVKNQKLGYALQITRNVAYLYFCISPMFYTFVGKKFQNYFRQMLVTRFPSLKRHVSVSRCSRSNMSTRSTNNEP